MLSASFNPSRGIAIIQTLATLGHSPFAFCFNPSRGIAIIQTGNQPASRPLGAGFTPSRGIAIIQTCRVHQLDSAALEFQSLTRDSNHSNRAAGAGAVLWGDVSIPHAG